MKKISFPLQMSCLTLAICTQLYAQDESNGIITNNSHLVNTDSSKLAPIVTTASRSKKSIANIAGTVYSIPSEDIAKQANAGKSTADILSFLIPSLTPSSGTTSNYGMTMRGRVVQYMIDGVPQTGSRDGSRQLNSISPSMIDRIEVVSGSSSIYGSGATGGIINIITKRGGDDPINSETKLGITSGDQFKSDALAYEVTQSILFNQGALKGAFGASYTQRGKIQDSRGKRIGPEVAQTDRQDTETIDVNGRLSWDISDVQRLSIGAQYYLDKQDSDYAPDYGPNLNVLFAGAQPSLKALYGLQLQEQPQTERWSTNVQYSHDDVMGQGLTAEAYYRKEQARWFPSAIMLPHAELPGGGIPVVMQSNTDIDVWGARIALQKNFEVAERSLKLSYGLDFENEDNGQDGQTYDTNTFVSSNGLNYSPTKMYAMGPDVNIQKIGGFIQGDYQLNDRIDLQAGIRHERIDSDVSDSIPYPEAIVDDMMSTYQAKSLIGGKIKHDATLYNMGGVYHLNDQQQVFANFSQGFSLPDVQRMLRDVPANFIVTSNNIEPIKVNNYELGWRLQSENGVNLGVSTFYNDSDKSVKFIGAPNYNIEVIDTDERIYGLEANAKYPISDTWNVGGTASYTRGQFKNINGKWQELDATRVAPLKGTVYSEWQFDQDSSLRVQALAVAGTDEAFKDGNSFNATVGRPKQVKPPAQIKGFATMDVIANTKAGPGHLGFGVYNVWNIDYKTIYSQSVVPVYGAISSLPAQGRTYGLSYTLKY